MLLLIAALLVPVTLVARYARGELLSTDRYVATVAPLASDPAVQTALANRVTNEIVSRIDLSTLITQAVGALNLNGPIATKGASALGNLVSGPVTDWLRSFIYKHVSEFIHSAAFQTLWTQINRLAHQGIEKLLTGEQGGVVQTQGDSVVLNIGPVVEAAKTALVADGFGLASKVPSVNVQYTLFQSDQIPQAQKYVRLLNHSANWLPWITLICFALALWVAPKRRRAAIIGLGIALVILIVVLVANRYVRKAYQDQLAAKGLNQDAGLAVYNQIVHYLLVSARTALAASVITLVWLWLVGPGRVGTALRRAVDPGFRWIATKIGWSREGFWSGMYAYRRWVFLVLGLIAFSVLLHNPRVGTVVWVTLVALVVTVVFAVVHRFRPPVGDAPDTGVTA